MRQHEFTVVDYVVGSVVMLVPCVIGGVFAYRDKDHSTREEYLLGGRDMHPLPVAMSIFITFMSAVSLIGVPSEVYMYGSMMVWFGLGLGLSYLVGVVSLVPLLHPLRLTSIYEYLRQRYRSETVRTLSTAMGMLTTVLHTGAAALLAPAFALEVSTGVPMWVSIILVGAVGVIYTAIGGIKSVVWTDAFQTVIVFSCIFIMIGRGVTKVGDVTEVYHLSREGGRTMADNWGPDPRSRMTLLGAVIGGLFMWLVNGFNQSTLQRIGAIRTLKMAKISFYFNFIFMMLYMVILVVLGNVIYAYIVHEGCDPFEAKLISNKNQIAPWFVQEALHDIPGMSGLYVAALCCGTLSTISSGINALAANTVEDVLRRPLKGLSERTITLVTKGFVVFHGVIIIGLAYGAKDVHGPVTQIAGTVLSVCGSPVLGVFIIGASVPWANKYGAVVGALVAFVFNMWVNVGSMMYGRKPQQMAPASPDRCVGNLTHLYTNVTSSEMVFGTYGFTNNSSANTSVSTENEFGFFLYDISYEWYSFMGTIVCVTVALLTSYFTKNINEDLIVTDPKYIFPFLRRFYFDKQYSATLHHSIDSSGTDSKQLRTKQITTIGL